VGTKNPELARSRACSMTRAIWLKRRSSTRRSISTSWAGWRPRFSSMLLSHVNVAMECNTWKDSMHHSIHTGRYICMFLNSYPADPRITIPQLSGSKWLLISSLMHPADADPQQLHARARAGGHQGSWCHWYITFGMLECNGWSPTWVSVPQ